MPGWLAYVRHNEIVPNQGEGMASEGDRRIRRGQDGYRVKEKTALEHVVVVVHGVDLSREGIVGRSVHFRFKDGGH